MAMDILNIYFCSIVILEIRIVVMVPVSVSMLISAMSDAYHEAAEL